MIDDISNYPESYVKILEATTEQGFDQLSDEFVGSFLATLCASKVGGNFLEIGTGTGLCTSWMLHGMSSTSRLITVDNQKELIDIAKKYLEKDERVEFVVNSGEELLKTLSHETLDLIFADTWPGKYNHLEEALDLLKVGGLYVIDDMSPIESWPDSHKLKAEQLEKNLIEMNNFTFTKMNWSTGLMVGVKNA